MRVFLLALFTTVLLVPGATAMQFVAPLEVLKRFDEDGLPPFAGMLIHVREGEAYTVCLPAHMNKQYPGIDEEFKAAVEIWASYIGRSIKVRILNRKLSLPANTKNLEAFKAACGDAQLLVAFKPMSDGHIGRTQLDYRFGWQGTIASKKITSVKQFSRWLYLKQPDPPRFKWRSWRQHFNNNDDAGDMITSMRRRKTYAINDDAERLTLRTIVHEMGHVWGLCDQYEYAGGGYGNCDRDRGSRSRDGRRAVFLDSMMGGEPWQSHLFLKDEDIRGIRRLAARFPSGWDTENMRNIPLLPATPPPRMVKVKTIEKDPSNPSLAVIELALNQWEPVSIVATARDGNTVKARFPALELRELSYRSYRYRLSRTLLQNSDSLEIKLVKSSTNAPVWSEMIRRPQFP